jgi:hypothetical protein
MEETKPKAFVFVLMPFSEKFNDVYELGVKAACKDAGAFCERVDEQIFEENILERVYNQIAKADIIIAEMTERNPNVFYEAGYAHALNKRVILLTQSADDIPFDLKPFPHIVYGGKIALLKSQLEMRVRWCIDNPKDSLTDVDVNLSFFAQGIPLVNKPEIFLVTRNKTTGRIKVDVYNAGKTIIRPDSIRFSLIVPEEIKAEMPYWDDSVVKLPDGRYTLHLSNQIEHVLFPNSWSSLRVDIVKNEKTLSILPVEIILRLHTAVGAKDYPFMLNYIEDNRND